MDLLNNLLFTALNDVGTQKLVLNYFSLPEKIAGSSNYLAPVPQLPTPTANYYTYKIDVIEEFCAIDDAEYIESAIQKHWADIVLGRNYVNKDATLPPYSSFKIAGNVLIPPYHMIYAYLVENTRIAQIFERLLHMYMHDEKLNKATTPDNRLAFQWIINTENLFFKELKNSSYRSISSHIRSSNDANRRNAYFRMFGMDLAFGDLQSNAPVSFLKAEFNNQPFILLFEKFLTEIWQAYTNASNTSGANSTDLFTIVDTAQKIQEMLMSRRTTEMTFENYRYFNLSREEYASVVMMSWLYEVVSYDSPVVKFLRCNGNTPGERLINIGNKVGLPAHSKSEGLLDIAPVMNTLLRRIELGNYNDAEAVRRIIISNSNLVVTPVIAPEEKDALNNLLLIINNWEKATGHAIKASAGNVTGIAKVQQANGVGLRPAMN
jgi:hypothetical protein